MAKEIPFNGKELDPTTAKVIVDDVLVQGARPITWWKRQGTDLHNKFMDTVRQSMEAGEGIDKLRKRIGGGVIDGAQVPGIMKAAKHNAEALGRTAVNKITNEARLRTFEANDDVVKGVKQVSTLDNRTSVICAAYSNKQWSLPDYTPIAPTTLPFNGGPPRHFNCRSTLVPILKSWEELGLPFKELTPTTRASMDGQVPADTTFDAFLKKKGTAFQDKLLGPVRARLWRSGKISLQQMLDFRGQPLSPEELLALSKKKRAAAAGTAAVVAPPPPKYQNPQEPAEANKWHAQSWEDAPGYIGPALDAGKPLSQVTRTKEGAYHWRGGNLINMTEDYKRGDLRAQVVWRHEYGHHIDNDFTKHLTPAQYAASKGYISNVGKLKSAFQADGRSVKKAAKRYAEGQALFRRHMERIVRDGKGVDWIDSRLKEYGLTYREMRDLHYKHMGTTAMDSANDVAMRNKMVHLLVALETQNPYYYLNQVWENGRFFYNGIEGTIADLYGAQTLNEIGYGHSLSYYKKNGYAFRTTEGFANVTAILGGERGWAKVIRALGHSQFLDQVEILLKNKGVYQ